MIYDSDYAVRLATLRELGGDVTKKYDSTYEIDLEILNIIQGGGISDLVIDDTSVSSNKTWSSSKIVSELADAGFNVEIVTELPSVGDPHTIYLVLKTDSSVGNVYDEWMYIDDNWEMIGNTQIDLSDYATLSYVDASLARKADVYEVATVAEIEALFIPAPVGPSNNQLWYTTNNGNPIDFSNKLGSGSGSGSGSGGEWPEILSNELVDGKYVITFAEDLTEIPTSASGLHNSRTLSTIIIPNSVTSIGDRAFFDCRSLTSITIPNNVTSIGEDAFYFCIGLTSLTIGNNVTSIGEDAFQYCRGLTSLTIPNSVTSIGKYTFSDCSNLTSISYTGTISQWNAITKGAGWHSNVPATVVHCTDGNVNL